MAGKRANKTGRSVSRDRSPASNFERGAADVDIELTRDRPGEADPFEKGEIGGGPGASDATSGGGAGAGIPDGDLALRSNGRLDRGDVQEDKKKLFPNASGKGGANEKMSRVKNKNQGAPKDL